MITNIIIFIGMIVLGELGAYAWHRWAAHSDIIPVIPETHDIHHEIKDDVVLRDYIYILIIMIIIAICLSILNYINILSVTMCTLIYVPLFLVFIGNWYIHWAYHTKNHWLNNYEWFKNYKRIHIQHHINQEVNYGVASHFSDKLFGTFDDATKNK